MLPRVRKPLDEHYPSNYLMNKSEIFTRPQTDKQRQQELRTMKRSTYTNKSSSNRIPSDKKLEIAVTPDLTLFKELNNLALTNGFNTNKANYSHEQNLMQNDKSLSQKDIHNENVNILNRKREIVEPQHQILSEAVTADGKQQFISKCLKGRNLAKATNEELHQNFSERQRVYPLLVPHNSKLINYQPTKASIKAVGTIASYAANTNQGISRNYNEDRVSIILNISKGNTKCSFFAIYDGHGGSSCCDYLRDSLHDHIINHSAFPDNPRQALTGGVKEAENSFLKLVREQQGKDKKLDRSGSCGIITLVIGDTCYVANIGDSRAVLSAQSGQLAYNLSRDHKPTDLHEQRRIQEAGGKIYKTEIRSLVSGCQDHIVSGPLRVFPGKLSVTRTFGDIEAKDEKLGGNNRVVIAEPEIKHFEIKPNHDFIILGSDGIFDKLESKDAVKIVWQTVNAFLDNNMTIHELLSVCVEEILREVMNRRSLDNITIVIIGKFQTNLAFKNFENAVAQMQAKRSRQHSQREDSTYRSK